MIGRRSLLLAGVALPVAAHAQCVTDTPAVDACRGGVRITSPPGVTLDLSFMVPGSMPPGITFTRASTATYFDSTGTLQTAATNAPRWDYDPVTHALRGVLIEEARTNVLLNSATLGTQSVAVTAQAYTLSFYGTGTITKTGTATGALVGTGVGQRVSQVFTPTAGTLTCTVTGSVLNAQLEAGSFATSWIPSTAASVTRAFDDCSIPPAGTAPWFASPGGSWMVEFVTFNPTPGGAATRVVGVPGAGGVGPVFLTWGPPALSLGQYDNASMNTSGAVSSNVVSKGATTWAAGNAQACLNGGAVASSATLATGYATLASSGVRFGANTNAADGMSGYFRRVRYWPRALTNAELQQVTT